MATNSSSSTKLRILLIPFFATSHMEPFTELAIRLAEANEAVEATVAVTPANVPIVQSLLDQRGNNAAVRIVIYPFPTIEGIPEGVENLGKAATPDVALRFRVGTLDDELARPVQETLIRAQSPDAIVTDMLFVWNGGIADELGVPCVAFSVIGAFSMLAVRRLLASNLVGNDHDAAITEIPRFPGPPIRIPRTELPDPDFFRTHDYTYTNKFHSLQDSCFGFALNTSSELEKPYCEVYTRRGEEGYVKRAYFLGPVALRAAAHATAPGHSGGIIMDWLDSKPSRSVVYVSFGSMAQAMDAQLDELALGLETSGKSFLWVVRGKEEWAPPTGWEDRVQDRGFIIRSWAPQTAILGHRAVGAFVTQCGWNSILETLAAGVPVLTWPIFFEQFITERQVTDVLGIGERLWPDGAGRVRSQNCQEHGIVPAGDVAQALTTFMSPGGPGDMARSRVVHHGAKARAAVAQGGSSHRDLHRLVDDLLMAAAKKT